MSVRTKRYAPPQRVAIELAKKELDADGVVHVWGPPIQQFPGERLCTQQDGGHNVVFHPRAVPMTNGGWACRLCGETSNEEPDGTA